MAPDGSVRALGGVSKILGGGGGGQEWGFGDPLGVSVFRGFSGGLWWLSNVSVGLWMGM